MTLFDIGSINWIDPGTGDMLKISGPVDFSAPRIQLIEAPRSKIPLALPSIADGSILPRRWTTVEILTQGDRSITAEDIAARDKGILENLKSLTEENKLPLTDDLNINPIKDALKGIENKVGTAATFVIAVLVLTLLIKRS